MSDTLATDKLQQVPLETLTVPRTGMFNVYADYWWPVTEDGNLLFYRGLRKRGYGSPQCNAQRVIAERISGMYPMPTTLRQLPVVFVPMDPQDYV